MRTAWPPISTDLLPPPGGAAVFLFALDLTEMQRGRLTPLLDAEETARAARFRFDRDRQRFIAAHGQVRQILGRALHTHPDRLTFTRNDYGKPALNAAALSFNLSHSGGAGLLAVACGPANRIDLGVDIEWTGREVDVLGIASHYFNPIETAALTALPAEAQRTFFYDTWTGKEAYIKAHGEGLTIPLSSFTVLRKPGEPAQLIAPEPGWTLYPLTPGPEYSAALVSQVPLQGFTCTFWPPEALQD